ncbi:hypothetical protein FK530_24235 [Tsukamurella conjunctivitidis]|uniref:Uncharacterized protein n=2 Tax=Tsukamurella conjunctivitidis TaxID=2592068 RepID=A0A5C5RMB1_9ACTN|nr:hypothetical protein FK530_24235 [Tsukamurella conjunctivitidis]
MQAAFKQGAQWQADQRSVEPTAEEVEAALVAFWAADYGGIVGSPQRQMYAALVAAREVSGR